MRPYGLKALAVCLLMAADAPKDDVAKRDLEMFHGYWQLVSAVRDGKQLLPEEVKQFKLAIQGNKFVLQKDAVVISEGTFTLDPSRTPKEIDETATAGPNKGKTFLAIYEIKDDRHRICFAAPGQRRPAEFSSTAGSGQLLQVWKRERK
jgi:uncharacterized protein (TIGR03067 family)